MKQSLSRLYLTPNIKLSDLLYQ